jgi:hypothetical protein
VSAGAFPLVSRCGNFEKLTEMRQIRGGLFHRVPSPADLQQLVEQHPDSRDVVLHAGILIATR